MMRGFYNGVSGIKTQSFGMDVWSNNISNINNVGFKASTPEFKSIFYQTVHSAGNTPTSDQVGLGATRQTTALDMSNGSFQNTDNKFDMAIAGDGYFGVLGHDGNTYYTRNGAFDIDGAGNLVNSSGNFVLGTMNTLTPTTASISAMTKFGNTTQQIYTPSKIESINLNSANAQTAIKLPKFLYLASEPTTQVNFRGNLDSTRKSELTNSELDASSYTYSVDDTAKTISVSGKVKLSDSSLGYKAGDTITIKVTDASGKFSEFSTQLDKDGVWSIQDKEIRYLDTTNLNVSVIGTANLEVANTQKLSTEIYDASGVINKLTINLTKQVPQNKTGSIWNATATITDSTGAVLNTAQGELRFNTSGLLVSNTLNSVGSVALNFGGNGDPLAYDGITSSSNSTNNFNITKNGYDEGVLKDYEIDNNGNIVAVFDNARMFPVAKFALYHFQNDQGLDKMGDNLYTATANSGEPIFYTNKNGEVIYGATLSSYKLEMSNVDLGQALTEIIVVQKAYDASSKSITTSDEMIQTAINMKR
ncbi:flagellar hook protein FlgE [Campylobacter sp. faydin G-140]|uniref:flagellar hook-basal body complex protein n=1 Tax=Campylobacter anatolicus TaxID=2829105 RepID=UPI001B9316E5|nr:flagellar hook-basal body complex protein [Campylobacter anatolicus]MBR8466233.1 flagellar hook protein FlgE [Campylobacter anatolicus]